MNIPIKSLLVAASLICAFSASNAADAAANWTANCASCHAKDGSGSTVMGKKNGAKDYRDAKVQASFSDEKAAQVIKEGVADNGKTKMKSFKDKLTDDEIKALVGYIRKFKQ